MTMTKLQGSGIRGQGSARPPRSEARGRGKYSSLFPLPSSLLLLGVLWVVPVVAQQPSPAQVPQMLSTPGAADRVRQQIQASGLTPDQIRSRLASAGYSSALLDQYLGTQGPGT